MPKYAIDQYEIHTLTYHVEADSEAEAVKKLFDDEAEPVDGTLEFIGVAEDLGLCVEGDYRRLAEELQSLGVRVDDVIPSIRCIVEIE